MTPSSSVEQKQTQPCDSLAEYFFNMGEMMQNETCNSVPTANYAYACLEHAQPIFSNYNQATNGDSAVKGLFESRSS
jgi:hypothetical protein